jgi:Cu/Ag efflux protein CusF
MKRVVVLVTALMLAGSVVRRAFGPLTVLLMATYVAWAAQTIEGKIKSVDHSGEMITLVDGTTLMVPPDLKVLRDAFKTGATVRATYIEKGGQKVVTSIVVHLEKES